MQARYEPVNLAAFTADLASVFRSAVERAGLSYQVDCEALPEPVYIDREMWEKVVLNLLSNALKFTFDGTISVTLGTEDTHAVPRIADTGTGVAAGEMPRLFERFHRIPNARSRFSTGQRPDGTPVLTAVGEIDMSNAGRFRQALSRALDGDTRIVVDLAGVEYLDSAGLTVLFTHAAHIELVATPLLAPVLTISGLADITHLHKIDPGAVGNGPQ